MDVQTRVQIISDVLKRLYLTPKIALNYSSELELLIAVILSAQCTDKKVNEVTAKLFQKYTTLDDYADANFDEFCKDIHSTGFYRAKTKNIIRMAQKVRSDFGGKVPQTMADLITLPGVARKSANVVLAEAFGILEGIAIDTHMIRLCNKFGLTKEKDPVKIEKDLMKIIPHKQWRTFSLSMVQYGRDYSPAHKVKADDDPISVALHQTFVQK